MNKPETSFFGCNECGLVMPAIECDDAFFKRGSFCPRCNHINTQMFTKEPPEKTK